MGSPKFAADVLAGLVAKHDVVCVVTQPDAVAGRGHQLHFSAVKQFAIEHGIPVLQPQKISITAKKININLFIILFCVTILKIF